MGEGVGRGDREFVHARWRNRTMERLTCVGGPVVYRTGIICPPPIARLNYSSRDEPGQQTLHCFNRSPIIRQLLELQPTTTTITNQRWLYPGHGTIRRRYACTRARIKPLFHPSPSPLELCLNSFHSYDCRRSDNCRSPKGERAR